MDSVWRGVAREAAMTRERLLCWLFDTREWMGWEVECWWWLERKLGKLLYRVEGFGYWLGDVHSVVYRKRKQAERRHVGE